MFSKMPLPATTHAATQLWAAQVVRLVGARFTGWHLRQLKNNHNSVTAENKTHTDINYFGHKDLGNHLLQ
jgi:hypothetical protein